jgi:hypothetical protein
VPQRTARPLPDSLRNDVSPVFLFPCCPLRGARVSTLLPRGRLLPGVQARRTLDATWQAGGEGAAAERRRRFDVWRALPADTSSGCIDFSLAAAPDVRAALKRAAATAVPTSTSTTPSPSGAPAPAAGATLAPTSPTALAAGSFAQGAGGSLETFGLRVLTRRETSEAALAAAALGMPTQPSSDGGGEGGGQKGPRSEKEAAADAARCAAIRTAAARHLEAARSAHGQSSGAVAWREGLAIPDAIRMSLLDPPASTHFAAICSTKVRLAGVKRGCHVD